MKTTIRTITFALYLAGASVAPLAGAREIDVAAGVARLTTRSPTFDAVSGDDAWTLGALEVSAEAARLPWVDVLHAELAYTAGASHAFDFEQFDATLQLYTIHLGARAMHLVGSRLRAFARADLGVTIGVLDLEDPAASATPLHDSALDVSAYGGAGLEVAVFRFPRLDLGVRLELGYFLSGALAFQARPDTPDDDIARLPTFAADLGTIDPSGIMGRLVAIGRF